MSAAGAGGMSIREARMSDLPAIVEIEKGAFSDPWSLRSFEGLLGRPEAIFDVAIRREAATRVDSAGAATTAVDPVGDGGRGDGTGRVVGFCVCYMVLDEAELANVAVGEEARREGVGRRLVEHVIATVRSRGARELFLEVRVSNVAARTLYAKLGFAEVGRRTRYYDRPVEDALILRLPVG